MVVGIGVVDFFSVDDNVVATVVRGIATAENLKEPVVDGEPDVIVAAGIPGHSPQVALQNRLNLVSLQAACPRTVGCIRDKQLEISSIQARNKT